MIYVAEVRKSMAGDEHTLYRCVWTASDTSNSEGLYPACLLTSFQEPPKRTLGTKKLNI